MRLHAIGVKDFRGLRSCRVTFRDTGVNLLQGPNEAGKTSLAQAVDLLFDELDSTRKKRVLAAQPAGQDVGPEIEVEASSGRYRFRYRKRFLRHPLTELEVIEPAPQSLTGREAHERVRAVLAETMDLDLWRALRVGQGTGLTLPELDRAPSLLEALGKAATGTSGGDDPDLLERAREEALRYYTEKRGLETGPLRETAAEAERLAAEVERLEGQHREVEEDAERRDSLARELVEMRRGLAVARVQREEARESLAKLEALRAQIEKLEPRADGARAELALVRSEHDARLRMAGALEETVAEIARQQAEIEKIKKIRPIAESAFEAAQALVETNRGAVAAAETRREGRQRELQWLLDRGARSALVARIEAVQAAEEEIAAAGKARGDRLIRDKELDTLEEARLQVGAKEAALDVAAPTVHLESLGPAAAGLRLDGEPAPLEPESPLQRTVQRSLRIELPGTVRVTVNAGGDAAERARELDEARTRLEAACRGLGVATLEEARTVHRRQREAEHRRLAAKKRRDEALAGEELAALRSAEAALRERVESHRPESPSSPVTVAEVEEAREAVRAAEADVAARRRRLARDEAAREIARDAHFGIRASREKRQQLLSAASEKRTRLERELAASRTLTDDDALARRLAETEKTLAAVHTELGEQRRALQHARPAQVQARAEKAEERVPALEDAHRRAELEARGLEEQLRVRGEAGLFEKLETTRARLEHTRLREASLRRHAGAARLLTRVLLEERDAARTQYARPLKERIESLGRRLFGESFSVDLDESLRVTHRRLDGSTLAFEALSAGAREQLAVISRLAAAQLASTEEEVSVILDDTLGYSDPQRLRAMNEILELAGVTSQIIVLTCHPDRYRHVRGAHLVDLPAPGAAAAAVTGEGRETRR